MKGQHIHYEHKGSPYLFIFGCPRSGTTLLQRMLNAHPQFAIVNDTHIIPSALKGRAHLKLTPDLLEAVVNYRRFYRLGLTEEAASKIGKRTTTFPEFMSEIYSEIARVKGKTYGGEKTPDYVVHMPLLSRLFPNSRFIHIVRDGRDVALSMVQWASTETKGPSRFDLWKENPLAMSAAFWKWQVRTGLEDAHHTRNPYIQVRYEDLVADAQTTLENLCAFLDLPFSEAMLRYYETPASGGSKSLSLPPTTGLRNWRNQMSSSESQLFEAVAGDLLADLGYQRFHSSFSSENLDLAQRCMQWIKEMQQKNRDTNYPI